jgi:PAS domain-containing protein
MPDTSMQHLINFLDTLPEPRIVLDKDYSIIGANLAYLDHYHAGDLSVTGHKCYEVSHGFSRPCDEEGESCPLKVSLKTGRVQRVLHIHHTPRGDEHVDVELTPVRNSDEEFQYFIEMIHMGQYLFVA